MKTNKSLLELLLKSIQLASMAILAGPGIAFSATDQMSDEAIIDNAASAAPVAIGANAKVIQIGEDGQMRVLREGTNNFTCMADNPASPGNDPMCLDGNSMLWAGAWMGKTEPPVGAIGFGYMLQGGSDASNTDPYAKGPETGEDWVDMGPHVMIFNYGSTMTGYTDPGGNPDASIPFVMWGDTPYAHLMIPVED